MNDEKPKIEETPEEQPSLFGKVDVLRNTLEEEMTILSEAIDKAKSQISKLGVKIGSLETRKENLYAMVKAVKDKEIVLGDGEPGEDQLGLDERLELNAVTEEESQTESL